MFGKQLEKVPIFFFYIMPMMIQNSYKASHNLTKKWAAVTIHWSRTAQGLNVNFVYQGPGRTVSPRKVFISEWSQNLQHMLLGGWEGGRPGCSQK